MDVLVSPQFTSKAVVRPVAARPVVRGKFIFIGSEKIYIKGVSYGAFEPDEEGHEYRDLEKIDDSKEARLARQLWSDVQKTDWLNGIDFDLTFLHAVALAGRDMGAGPDAHAASDFTATNAIAKTLGEDHDESLHRRMSSHPALAIRMQ